MRKGGRKEGRKMVAHTYNPSYTGAIGRRIKG
jgi:hypothetical protein